MATLTAMPKGQELEEFVSALFQCSGCYTERQITERAEEQVLELDVVATDYRKLHPAPLLIEVKSGGWGFPEIFKVRGWMDYLAMDAGAFIVSNVPEDKNFEFYQEKASQIGIKLVGISDFGKPEAVLAEVGLPVVKDDLMFEIWRYAYWIERRVVDVLRAQKKSIPGASGPREAMVYLGLVNDGLFFISSLWSRINALYEAYQQHPRLTLSAAWEMAGNPYDPADPKNCRHIGEALYRCEHKLLQGCMYVEHRARLAILRTAVDYLHALGEGASAPGAADLDQWALAALPDTFTQGLQWLKTCNNYWLYPYLWQTFLWAWGGFLLTDREKEELSLLSEHTGVPVDEMPTALDAFDKFFPSPGGWFADVRNTNLRIVKMVPCYFQGLGAYLRLKRYSVEDYSTLGNNSLAETVLLDRLNSAVSLLDSK